ncbi:MAG TPA: hypothetical protein VHD35_02730 [Chitinophagaceae bacterium]|nr:hypothetical protein [Chitinophagaceae bacterium]
MYKQIETVREIFLPSAVIVSPLATLEDECGGRAHIIEDDHCLMLCIEQEDGFCKPTTHLFREAILVIKNLEFPD